MDTLQGAGVENQKIMRLVGLQDNVSIQCEIVLESTRGARMLDIIVLCLQTTLFDNVKIQETFNWAAVP